MSALKRTCALEAQAALEVSAPYQFTVLSEQIRKEVTGCGLARSEGEGSLHDGIWRPVAYCAGLLHSLWSAGDMPFP